MRYTPDPRHSGREEDTSLGYQVQRPAKAVEEEIALRNADIDRNSFSTWNLLLAEKECGVGLTTSCPAWSKAKSSAQRKMMLEKVRHQVANVVKQTSP